MTLRPLLPALLLSLPACGDRAPGPALITLSPAQPTTVDDLVAIIDKDALEPEGQDLAYTYLWYKDDELQDDQGEATIAAEWTTKGETWRVEVAASDGSSDGPPVAAQVVVVNTAPTVTISLSPDVPTSEDDIIATIEAQDPDGDAIQTGLSWTRDGVAMSHDGTIIPAEATLRWQTWEIFVTSNDGEVDGEIAEAGVLVDNQAPTATSVTIEPTEAYEESVLTGVASTTDLEGDVPTLLWAWYVDGSLVSEGEEGTLEGEYFDKGQQVTVTVTPTDPYDEGDLLESDAVEILNSPATIESVTIEPTELYEADTASCTAVGLGDPDDDEVDSVYTWYVNGTEVSSDTTIDGDLFSRGDTVQCDITANDGQADGAYASSDVVTVLNTPPFVSDVTLSPTSPAEGDTIIVTLVDAADDDGDTVTASHAWYVDGTQVSTVTELASDSFDKHQEIYVEVTITDGIEDGDTLTSATATAVNTPPTITGLSFDPENPTYRDTALVVPEGWYDADGDAESYLYSWYVDGTVVSTESSLDLSTQDRGLDVYVQVTPWDEDDAGTTFTSDTFSILALLTDADADLNFLGDSGDQAGQSLALGGDLTGDGVPDIVIGAPGSSDAAEDAGAVYLVPGTSTGEVDWNEAEIMLVGGEADEQSGSSVAWVGDVDADGSDDLLVGVPGDATFGTDSGVSYLVLGPITADDELGSAGVAILGQQSGEAVGCSVAGGGDMNEDGYDDIIVGAYGVDSEAGAVYLGYGPITSVRYLDTMDIELTGEAAGDNAGWAVAMAGDLDGNGADDVLIGAQSESTVATEAGAAYVLYGPITTGVGLGSADAKLTGEAAWDYAGYSVSPAGDVDGDGLGDVLVGARYEDSGGGAAGAVYLLLGPVSGTASLSTAHAKLLGGGESETAGNAIAPMGDIDSDGYGDIAIGAVGRAEQGTNTGVVYVITGPITGTITITDTTWSQVDGSAAGDKLGYAVAGGQDVDGDGLPDLIVGAPYEDGNGTSSGTASLFSGAGL